MAGALVGRIQDPEAVLALRALRGPILVARALAGRGRDARKEIEAALSAVTGRSTRRRGADPRPLPAVWAGFAYLPVFAIRKLAPKRRSQRRDGC
jgi:hypothetical protein